MKTQIEKVLSEVSVPVDVVINYRVFNLYENVVCGEITIQPSDMFSRTVNVHGAFDDMKIKTKLEDLFHHITEHRK